MFESIFRTITKGKKWLLLLHLEIFFNVAVPLKEITYFQP